MTNASNNPLISAGDLAQAINGFCAVSIPGAPHSYGCLQSELVQAIAFFQTPDNEDLDYWTSDMVFAPVATTTVAPWIGHSKSWTTPKRQKLTQKIVREYIRILGGTFRRDAYGDLIVRFGEDTYHTTDLDDAIGTARCMKGGSDRIVDADEYLNCTLGYDYRGQNKHRI